MEIREILYVKTIADFGNLTKAAKHLQITQPSLSQSLKNIETSLGVPLFTRTKRGMVLTEYGVNFINDASPVLSAYFQFMHKVKHYEKKGATKQIGLYKSSYTTPINTAVMNFISLHNSDNYIIKVESISNLERLLQNNEIDIAIIKYPPIYKRDKNLIYDTLFKESLYVLLNKDHPLSSRTSLKISELEGNHLITSDPAEYPYKMIEKILNRAGVKLDIHTYTNYTNLSMIFDLVSQGLGISFATTRVCDYFNRDDVVKVPLDDDYDYEVCVVQKNPTNENKDLIDFIRKHVEN